MPIRPQIEIDTIIGNGQTTLGDLAYKYVTKKMAGTWLGADMKDDAYRAILLWAYLDRVIDPDGDGVRPYLLLTENDDKLNSFLDAIVKLSDIFDVPGIPILGHRRLPLLFYGIGQPGATGTSGTDGANANIIVAPDPAYNNIKVTEGVVGLVKTYLLAYDPYTLPVGQVAIQGVKVREIGVVITTLTVIVTSTRGRELIVRREIVAPPGIVLANPDINNPGPQAENVFDSNVDETTTYQLEVEDDEGAIATANDTITFVYPFLSGDTDTNPPSDHYQDLDKLVATKSTKLITLDGVNKFFWFGYPATYGDLASIKDQNGFNVTASWTKVVVNVSSQNLDNNWVNVSYIFYRHTIKTTINNALYTFNFP